MNELYEKLNVAEKIEYLMLKERELRSLRRGLELQAAVASQGNITAEVTRLEGGASTFDTRFEAIRDARATREEGESGLPEPNLVEKG